MNVDPERCIRLQPVLASVGRARALVGDVASEEGVDAGTTGDAVLVVSELVTNAILHARTLIDVTVRVDGPTVRVEVSDASQRSVRTPQSAPSAARSAVEEVFDEPQLDDLDAVIAGLATTGRGLALVTSLARRWGVTDHDAGKTVWAEMAQSDTATAGEVPPAPDEPPPVASEKPGSPSGGASPVATLVAVPVRLVVDSDRQLDDTLRELQVIAMGGEADGPTVALARSATEVADGWSGIRVAGKDAVRAARERGDRLVDLYVELPDDIGRRFATLQALLEAVRDARSAGRLLVLPPSPEVVAFRRWYREEVTRQHGGAHLRPCPFPAVHAKAPLQGPAVSPQLSARRRALLTRLQHDLAVAVAADRNAVAGAAVRRVAADMGASFVNLLLADPDGRHVTLADRIGYSPDEIHGRRYPINDDNPIAEVVRTAVPIVLRTREERLDRYPRLVVSAPVANSPTGVWVPLGDQAPASGVMVVGFGQARDFTPTDLAFLLQVSAAVLARLRAT